MEPTNFEKQIAECVGLWLAEGSTTSKSEITFTNNCLDLIDLFHKTMNDLFKNDKFNQKRLTIMFKAGKETLLFLSDLGFSNK